MELECDLSGIQSEELLRKMWQQSEDINRKKDIRSQLYKLRESRLRDLYQFDTMSDNRVAGFGKDPLAPSHGESLVDQSFQSLKSKEIRDSMSPTEMKFHSMTLNNPNTTGWNVQSSSEVSPDGRGFRAETVATTDGVENINGGTAEFKGRNEQRSSAMHEGDDTNFVKKASESSNTQLQEKVVVGDENAGRTEVRTSSSTSTSSSQVIQSSTTDYDNGQPVQYLMDSNRAPQRVVHEPQYRPTPPQYEPQATYDARHTTDQSSTKQHYDHQTEQYRQNRQESNTSQNVQTNETHEQNKRYVDMDKASPEYQRQVQHLMSQPGEIISNTVEYPKPNVKMITTVKRLPDGTIVRNKRYETEETNPGSVPSHANNTRQTTSNQTNQRRESQTNQQTKNYREPSDRAPSERYRQPNDDIVDNVETKHYTHDTQSDNVETKYSTVKTSNRKFSTETTSEHVQEYDDRQGPASPGSRAKPATNSFSTHGFPSVRSNKPTQEFATDRPNLGHPSQDFAPLRDALIPVHGEPSQNIIERRIPTNDGEVIIVSSEKRRNVKQQTNSERMIETDIQTTGDNRYQNVSDVTTKTSQDFSTHGFPSVSEPFSQPKVYPDNMQVRPVGPGYSQGPPGTYGPGPTSDDVVVSSQKSHTTKHSTNTERIIETEILGDNDHNRLPAGNFPVTTPRYQSQPRSPTGNYTVTTPGAHYTPNQDFSTHGFPSVKSPAKTTPEYLPQGYPSARSPTRATPGYAAPRDVNKHRGSQERPQTSPVKTSPSTKKSSTIIETTERVIQKEKEVDANHRAFAASLRSSSPAESPRRDSNITDGPRHTPRSSVSSTKTFRRDMREGSHDSAAGSEASRVSTSTVTRQTPPKTVGGKTVVTKQTIVTSKNGTGPNEIHDATSPRGSKSPSPGKSVTTTTTTRTVTSKALPKDVPKPDNHQHITTRTTTTDTIFPINHEPLTITKTNYSENKTDNLSQPEVIEEPCIKKHMYLLYPSAPKNTDQKRESSPRSSPAPSSRSSPYPSKSKSPLGEDDQSVKSYTSRPLSPSSSTRSPIPPIGSKPVPNSSGQWPTNVVSDERRTVDRDTVIEETSTVVDDYLEEDVDSKHNVRRTMKQSITHETDLVPKKSPVKVTTSPQQVPNARRESTKRVDRSEEPKRPKPNDQTIQKQPSRPKPGQTTSTTLILNERKANMAQKVTPKNVGPSRITESPRKPQPKPLERPTSTPKDTKPKYRDDQNEDQCVPKGRYPDHVNFSETDDEPITSNVREIIVKRTNKKTFEGEIDEFEYDDTSEPSEVPNRNKSRPNKFQPIPNEPKPNKGIEGKMPKVQAKETSTALIVNERKTQTPQKVTPKNVGPTNRTESPHKPQPKALSRPMNTPKPTYYDDDDQHVPKGSYPDRVHFSETDDEQIISNVRQTSETITEMTNKKKYAEGIDEFESDHFPETSEIPNRNKAQPKKFQPILNEDKPNNEFEGKTPKVFSQNQKKPEPMPLRRPENIPKDKGQYVPKERSPDRVNLSETEDEFVGNNYRETTEITVKTTNKHSPTQREDDYPYSIPKYSRPEANKYEPNPIKTSHDLYPQENIHTDITVTSETKWSPTITAPHKDTKPKRPSEDNSPIEPKSETIKPSELETSAITIQTTGKKLHSSDEKYTLEPRVTPNVTVQQPMKYEPDFEVQEYDTAPDAINPKPNKPDIFKSTVTTHVKGGIQTKENTKDIHEQFIEAERSTHPELPDGSYISKTPGPVEPTSPTFKKKGVGRRDTFEDRCRQILGMENYGDTPGTFKPSPGTQSTQNFQKTAQHLKEDVAKSVFEVKIEDCGDEDDDDEPLTITSVKNTILEKKDTPSDTELSDYNTIKSKLFTADKKEDKPFVKTTGQVYVGRPKGNVPDYTTSDSEPDTSKKTDTRYPTKSPSPTKDIHFESVRITSKRVTNSDADASSKPTSHSPSRSPGPIKDTKPLKKPTTKSPSSTEPLHSETTRATTQRIEGSHIDVSRRPTSRSPSKPETTSNKPTSRSPSRSPAPIKDTKPLQKPTTKSPSSTEPLHFETTRATTQRIEGSDIDVSRRPTSRSPSKPETTSNKPTSRSPSRSPAPIKDTKPLQKPTTKSPSSTEPLHFETTRATTQRIEGSDIDVSRRPTSRSPSKPIKTSNEAKPSKTQPMDVKVSMQISPKSSSPTKERVSLDSPKRKPGSPTKTTTYQSVKDANIAETTTIKDRLRSSSRKERTPVKPDKVDAGSSPETSPSRYTARRRSSNISVNTEIIIEHIDSETVNKKTESKVKKQTESVYKEIVDSTSLPEKMPKKIPVTERKESAPVHRVTRKDKDSKMSRSTSENIIKVKKPEASTTLSTQSPKLSAKTPEHRRPNKCFATKTINLSTTDRLLSSEDMENVVIDIQQAKSSREPSPDKIVPTPVPAHLDTGKPRYPDVVQEPEDEPRRKPVIKNIPIFEEEHNNYVGCHITEVNIDKSRKTIDCSDYQSDEILNTPVVEAPLSLDYPQPAEVTDDECLLSVHDKVSKFQYIAKEVTKPKPSSPFNREFDESTRVPDDDECLLTVDEKVDKFIKTAQNLTKEAILPERDTRRPIIEVTVQDLDTTECTYTPVKLGPSAPQRSPELVRHISRNISRQSDVSEPSVEQDDYQHTYQSHEKETVSKRGAQKLVTHHKQTSAVRPQPVTAVYNDDEDDDGEELIPHTASHTTILEERRQKNILTRPSVFDNDKNKTPLRKTEPKYVSPVKDSEKSTTINKAEVKTRAKPDTPKHSTVHEKTTTVSTTSRRKQQSPQRPNPETDYDYRRSSVETGVSNNTTKQTKLYSTSGPKKSPQSVNKKLDRQSPLRTNITKNVKQERDDVDVNVNVYDDEDADAEIDVVANDRERELIINSGTAIRSTTTKTTGKINVRKEPTLVTNISNSFTPKKMKENPKSSTCSSPSKNTKAHLVDITERSTQKHNTTTTKTTDSHKSSETNEPFLEKPTPKKPPHPQPQKTKITTTDSVAARRSLFENNATTNTRSTPSASSSPGRRPSYMDHTKSSLEHIRRDSLELNKTNYTRKPSFECDDDIHQIDRDTQVKFDVPQKAPKDFDSETEDVDVDVEEIFDLQILERMLETVTSYELRRRIRAQIRLVKKNLNNVQHKKSETKATTKLTNLRDRSVSPLTSVSETGSKVTTKKQYYYREEERTSSSTHTSPERTQRITTTKVTRTHSPESKKSVSPSDRGRSPQHKPAQLRVCSKDHERSQSPDSTRVINKVVTSRKHYDYRNEHEEQVELTENVFDSSSPTPRRSSRKSPSPYNSPERHDVDNSKSPSRKPTHVRVSSTSPDNKVSSSMKTSARYEQSVIAKQPKRTPVANVTKGKPEQKTPVWADRKNVLKAPTTSTTPKKPSSVTDSRTSSLNKTVKTTSNQSQKHISNKSTYVEDDCITSSYGIGPTDENGLPLFGIRALKKKKPTSDACETTEEVTGYVVEEKYYSDNKSKPLVERKEIIYSTNPKELDAIKEKVKETTIRKSQRGEHVEKSQPLVSTNKTSQKTTSVRSSPEDSYLESSTKNYVRRGSVKEMSEKFIHKESSSSVSEKSNNYPKAGLILRTNSRRHSRDNEAMDGENIDSYETRDSEEDTNEGLVRVGGSTHSSRILADSESECESVQTQREFKKITSSTSSSSRSFLNTKGEEKIITNVTDVLDRMRNADNVVEDGETAEDQEARALLNKFLGASIIMKGVESTIPINRETKLITTTSTSSGKQPMKHEVKTTRVTKTIKSGGSSSPVTETTCDIEEIWDEETLKQLLEQARTYEERRKIRSRLRELMADRPEKKDCHTGTESAVGTTNDQSREQRSDSSASEYEEIIEIIEEEVTDSSDSDEIEAKTPLPKETAQKSDPPTTKVTEELKNTKAIPSEETDNSAESNIETDNKTAEDASSVTAESHTNPNPNDQTDSSEKGESANPALQGSMHQQKMLQNSQQNFQKVGVSSTYSKTSGGNTPKIISSDRSMHATNNTSSSAAQYSSQTPTVTVTAGRADNTSGGRDVSSCSKNNSSDVVGSKARQVDRLGVPQKEDSGTESGEDLRLIAAGLRDQLQMKSDSNIIDDVTCALSRLESSLKEGKDISVDTEKRKALLALVARLQDGLTSPEKLAEIAAAMSELDGNDVLYGETSSPEADAHRSGKQRFAKRRSRVNRHTVGVSREELADARRYMEDMLMMENISLSTTPEANTNSPPQWFPLEKNASSGAILVQQSTRQNCFLAEENAQNTVKSKLSPTNGNKRRPASGDFSVSFEPMPNEIKCNPVLSAHMEPVSQSTNQRVSPEKYPRFSNKKLLMKRANTIDLAKAKRFGSDFDTDSDAEDKSQLIGLKRAVHPSVKKRVQNVVPPFEPKTENDRKFLAFINKQSDKPGLGWTSSRSVSNWSNKFGNLKNSFEIGATTAVTAAKPPQVPGHQLKLHQTIKQSLPQKDVYSYATSNQQIAQRLHQEAERQAEERRRKLEYSSVQQRDADLYSISNQQISQRLQQEAEYQAEERRRKLDYETLAQRDAKIISNTNQQIAQRLHQEAERQAEERRRKLEYERMKYERRENDKLERQRQLQQQQQKQQERLQKERSEREYYERHIRDHESRTQHAQQNTTTNVPQPVPINEFKHAPQSVFRPIDSGDITPKTIYKPIPQLPTTSNTWQPPSPNNNPFAKADNSFITSPPPSSKSPIGLPWAAKPAVDASSFKSKANRFEERSRYDNYSNVPMLQRHNSLRMPNVISGQNDDFKKRPSLPNTTEPYGAREMSQQSALSYLPPPTNVSYIYDNRSSRPTYLSYPCLPTAVSESNNYRSREDSLTNPQAVPLVLTSANPSYCPSQPTVNQQLLPRDAAAHFDISSPVDSTLTSPSGPTTFQNDYTDDDIESDSLLEYRAISKVMGKPQCQTAVTVGRRTGHVSDDEVYGKNSKAAKNLLSTMKSIGNNGGSDGKRPTRTTKRPDVPTSPKMCLSPDGRSYQAPIVEPLFPDVTSYEPHRQPLYDGKLNTQSTPTSYSQSAKYGPPPRNQSMMYKSLENISMRAPTTNHSNSYVPQQPSQKQQLKPYVSETQTSYVVTYPTEDTTDDEEVYRHSRKVVPDSLPLSRKRNISESSTVSSNTASMTYANNLPSPNTSWTSNPIVAGDSVGQSYYNYNANDNQHFVGQPTRGEEPLVVNPMPSQYQHSQPPSEDKYTGKSAVQYQQTLSEPTYQSMAEPSKPSNMNYTTSKSQYTKSPATTNDGIKIAEHTTIKNPNQLTQPQQTTNYTVPQQQMKHPTTHYESMNQKTTPPTQVAPSQKVNPKPQPPKQGKPDVQPQEIIPKDNSYRSNTAAHQTQPQKSASSKPKQSTHSPKHQEKPTNKKSMANVRKSVSEDSPEIKQVTSVREQEQITSIKVSQKAVATKTKQHHTGGVSTDTRRQSFGNALNGQHREESRTTLTETHQSQQLVYKSSAPTDTPDIVKSSLPKDENQPILKKFGPPQRHHYMPNSYKSPVTNTGKSAVPTTSTTVHTKSIEVTTNRSILKTSQQTATSSKPIIVENPATPQPDDDYIPRNIVFNNVNAFTSMSRRQDDDRSQHIDQPVRTNKLCKSESWKQIINLQNQHIPQPTNRLPHPPVNELRRTKSGHSLAMPKMYEAAIDKTEISEKQNIMAAYFAANKSPTQPEQTFVEHSKRSVINRTKTSEKISASRKSLGSHVALSQEQQKSSTSTTEKTETKEQDGAVVTTTTKVTTRTVGGGTATKTVSPFTKFKQLDRQNSQQSAKSPTTPSPPGSGSSASPTVTGNARIFKFTDPALNARAATVKDQLLQWCQSKTKEYENVQITNFSACWVDGLAFCALIHHFLPDAFDYSQLTPENRRKNFELAFTVADEKAGIAPLLDVEDMVVMKRPDWKCVFVYVQSIYRRFRNCQ